MSASIITGCRVSYVPSLEVYVSSYSWIILTIAALVPCLVLLVLDPVMLVHMRRAEQFRLTSQREQRHEDNCSKGNNFCENRRTSWMIMLILSIVCCVEIPNSVYWAVCLMLGRPALPVKIHGAHSVIIVLIYLISYPFICLIYCCISSAFRRTVKDIVRCRFRRSRPRVV